MSATVATKGPVTLSDAACGKYGVTRENDWHGDPSYSLTRRMPGGTVIRIGHPQAYHYLSTAACVAARLAKWEQLVCVTIMRAREQYPCAYRHSSGIRCGDRAFADVGGVHTCAAHYVDTFRAVCGH